jgi:hypothetical protein
MLRRSRWRSSFDRLSYPELASLVAPDYPYGRLRQRQAQPSIVGTQPFRAERSNAESKSGATGGVFFWLAELVEAELLS